MHKNSEHGIVCSATLLVIALLMPEVCLAQRLLFKSGFAGGTVLEPIPSGRTGSTGYMQQLTGRDSTTGFSWPLNAGFNPQYSGLHLIPYNSDLLANHFLNSIETVTGHTGGSTRALFLNIEGYPSPSCCAQEILQTSGMAKPLKEVYYRFWEKLPPSLGTFLSDSKSFYTRTVVSYKTPDDYRIHLDFNSSSNSLHAHMHADAGGLNAASGSATACPYRDPISGAITHNCSADYHDFVNIDNDAIPIPINQWFLVEVYFKRSLGPDGRYFTAINGKTVGDTRQPDYGVDLEEIRDMYWVSLYNSLGNGSEWIDDLEIWDKPPCGTPPCGSGTSTTYTGQVPPFMTSRAGAIGEVGMPFSFHVTATGNPTYYYVNSGLPPGLSIDHMTGLISGTPASAGTTKCYIEATNSVGKGAQGLEIQINRAATVHPTISSFSASSSTINRGDWVQLSWTQNGAASLSINQGIGDVTGADPYPVRPNATTTYTLTATNAAGVVRAFVTVNVR